MLSIVQKTTAILILSLALAACGASKKAQPITGSLPQITNDNARIYFYRSKVPFLAAIEPEFLVDGKSVGKAVMNQALYRDAQPGNYVIMISSDMDKPVEITLSSGETRYIRAYGTTSVIRTYLSIGEVSKEQALKDLKGQKLLAPE
ncbi:hypothetical protein A9Q97_02335 [Rhodospirillales bacterium 47_12_T64]|nr:hypothetical protein A9Q97_02335 [Rhodospirillales bacterium 47_12_T64]